MTANNLSGRGPILLRVSDAARMGVIRAYCSL
jgi:hypothetical protein